MKTPLTADAAAGDTIPFDAVPGGVSRREARPRRARLARLAALALSVVVALVALATAGLRLLVLPWDMAVLLGIVLGFAFGLLALGILLIAVAVRGRAPGSRR
jgi:hypothetical protein